MRAKLHVSASCVLRTKSRSQPFLMSQRAVSPTQVTDSTPNRPLAWPSRMTPCFCTLPKKIKGKEEAEGPAELWFLAAGCKQRGWTLAGLWAWKCRRNTFGGIKVERVVGINDTSLLGWSLGWKINVDDAAPFRRRGGSADISLWWQI